MDKRRGKDQSKTSKATAGLITRMECGSLELCFGQRVELAETNNCDSLEGNVCRTGLSWRELRGFS